MSPNDGENVNPLSGLGVTTLVREIGMAMIPLHLRHTLDSIMQILDTVTRLRQFDQAPYTSHTIMLVALLRHVQMTVDTDQDLTPDMVTCPQYADDEALTQFLLDKRFGIFATNIYFSSLQLTESQIASNMQVTSEDVLFSWLADGDEVRE